MITESGVWTIFFLPIAAFAIISFIIRPFFNRFPDLASLTLISTLTAALALSAWTLKTVVDGGPLTFDSHSWLTIGDLEIRIGLMVDSLTAIMLVVVTGVSLMIQIYSQGYMKEDPGYVRYFAFMSLFTAAMLGVVIASNIIQLYVMWELVGLGSYLLIGFWYHRPAAAAAAKKAFIVTRIGDFGFLLAILYLFFNREAFLAQGLNPLEIADIHAAVPLIEVGALAALGGLGLTWVAVGIFAGAVGKSAQFPLHVWLPDAMEGPTPVSALIHAATMVAAGVFLVARFFPVFEASEQAMTAVAIIGAFTALFAATMALVMNDIKRVLAYSTISQLGYMMAALGIGAYGAAIFHLFNHAFFKSLLFLGAGSVNHATGTFDMRYMGGLRRYMPWTYVAMLIGGLSLVGIFPLSGFWSKDEILAKAWGGGGSVDNVVFWFLILGGVATGFYTFRMLYMTFHGEFKGGAEPEQRLPSPTGQAHRVHLAESPLVMVLPMAVLAIASIASGFLSNPQRDFLWIPVHWFSEFLVPALASQGEVIPVNRGLAIISMVLAVAAIGVATSIYLLRRKPPEVVEQSLAPAHQLLSQKYYIDHMYEQELVAKGFYRYFAGVLDWFDRAIVDSIADNIGWFWRNIGWAVRRLQTGQVQGYAIGISLGIVAILVVYLIWG